MVNEVYEILISIEKWANSSSISPRILARIKAELKKAKKRYQDFNPATIKGDAQKKVYEALIKKGNELVKGLAKKNKTKDDVYSFLRYANAAYFDFINVLGPLNTGIRFFTLSSALFLALSPQFLGPFFSIILILPIFLGLNALKKRRTLGYTMAMSMVPIFLTVSTLWLRFGHRVLSDYSTVLTETVKATGRSPELARFLIIFFPILSILLIFSTCFMAYKLFIAKDMLI